MTTSILLIGSSLSAQAEGETWVGGAVGQPVPGTMFFEINEVAHTGYSVRTMMHYKESQTPEFQHYCPTFNSKPGCQLPPEGSKFGPRVFSVLPVCNQVDSEDCVQDLYVSNASGEFIKGEFIRNVSGPKFDADQALGLIEGSTQALYRVPGAINAGGTDTYVVNVRAQLDYRARIGKFSVGEFGATVLPYRETPSNDQTMEYAETVGFGGIQTVASYGNNTACAWNEAGRCGVTVRYREGQKVKLSFRATNELAGWFSGRIKGPELQIEKFSPTANLFTVSGAPVAVPQFRAVVPKTSTISLVVENVARNPNTGGISNNANSGRGSFDFLTQFKDFVGDKAVGFINPFSLTTVRGGSGCFADTSKVLGIVTTDSMVFEGSPPVFTNGQLEYKVAGLHYAPDGKTVIEGNYDLVMRSEVARCLYGFTSAPVQASISVVSENGEAKVATTVLSESKGWLKLAAYGFTFSNPSILVKLTQARVVPKKTTVLCVKGKVAKKVTAVNPKCPAGFKKK